jgi:hypothetical protein
MSIISTFIDNLPKCTNNNLTPSCDNNKFLNINCSEMTREQLNNFCFHDSLCRVICPKDITSIKNAVPDYNNSSYLESFKNYIDKSAENILGKSLVERLSGSGSIGTATSASLLNSNYSSNSSSYSNSSNSSNSSSSSSSSPSSSSSSSSLCFMIIGAIVYMAIFNVNNNQNPENPRPNALINTDSSAPISTNSS